MKINLQPTLENDKVILLPLQNEDFEGLYEVAADPKIWEQHPNKERWQKEVFKNYFEGAVQSGGAFKIIDKTTENFIGSTRFYDYDEKENSIFIGYTFFATKCWGTGTNLSIKALMFDYIFQFVSNVHFHIGANNVRSQIAIGRLGTTKIAEEEVAYFGEQTKLNYVYSLSKEKWLSI